MESQGRLIVEVWRAFLRQFWVIFFVSSIGTMLTIFVAFILPPIYQSEARILVESQQIPDDLARSTVMSDAIERLQLIEQRLMTRDNLLRVIEEQDLFVGRTDMTLSEKIDALRSATVIRPIALKTTTRRRSGQDLSISAFTIAVRFEDAEKASKIANDFVTKVLDQNARARSERATETADYFEAEEQRLANALSEIETEITTFKNENEGRLPDSMEYRRGEVTRLAEAEFNLEQRLLELEEERSSLEIQLAQLRDTSELEVEQQASAEEQELRRLETTLAQKRAVFAESHREIKALKAQIGALEAVIQNAPARAKVSDNEATSLKLRTAEATMSRRLELLTTQIELISEQRQGLREKRRRLEESILETPRLEMQLNVMNRKYNDLQEQYAQSVAKRAVADTGEKLELNQQAERFEVIENALVADKPVAPDRRRLVILGSAASVALSAAIAFLLEVLNPTMRTAAQMERALDLRPVATIPYIRTRKERINRAIRLGMTVLIVVIGLPASLWAIDTYYLPLQLLFDRFIDQAGLEEVVRVIVSLF